ncbi:MAG: 2-oxoacid:acceptor oxidoreductase family protein [Pirellulaceae bacterium]
MMRIRFHGRGGQGVKTASRILGTAAFRAGFWVQDSPIYGAERRGAPVAAFTRLDRHPILERGVITDPTVVIIADESLLHDPAAGVATGLAQAVTCFVNTARTASEVAAELGVSVPVMTRNLSGLMRQISGTSLALSAGLAAAAARMVPEILEASLLAAVAEELTQLGARPDRMEMNCEFARQVYQCVTPAQETLSSAPAAASRTGGDVLESIPWDGLARGTPSILRVGNAAGRHTGSWRTERPEVNYERCTRCGICVLRCPDAAIALNAERYPVIDYDHCKGCLICSHDCPVEGAMAVRQEVPAW